MSDALEIFKGYCRNNNMRYTPERELIIKEAYRKDGHFYVDELFLRIRNKNKDTKLSKASIYRAIPHLIRAGLIRESLASDGRICYEHSLGHEYHDHMECIVCGNILEFYDKRISGLQEDICKNMDFHMISQVNVIKGICSSCAKKNSIKNKRR